MSLDVFDWLSNVYSTKVNSVRSALKNENASSFLIVWSIFEQTCFNGFVQKDSFKDFIKNKDLIQKLQIENTAKHFYDRYQNKKYYKNLCHGKPLETVDQILSTEYDKLTLEDKIMLTLFTTYRYRNNIFHGNKGVMSWNRYKEQINLCLDFMMQVVDEYNRRKATVASA